MAFWQRMKRAYINEAKGSERGKERILKQELLKMTREDIEDSDVQSFQHRHSVLWDIL